MKTRLPLLKIDNDFKGLIPPLNTEEYENLSLNIIVNGCLESIKVWRGYIIDGHNRYSICHEYDIDFSIEVIELNSKEDAVSWICANILTNREMPENFRRYLIGKKYYAEKTVGVMNITGTNQYTIDALDRKPHSGKTASKIGEEYHISHSTVNKYLQYAKSIDRLKTEYPDFAREILYEEIKISQDNLIELAKKSRGDIIRIIKKSAKHGKVTTEDICSKANHTENATLPDIPKGSVKDMPVFDPDAYVSSLTLTIPSWISSIKRTAANSNVSELSLKARYDLVNALDDLIVLSTTIKNLLEDD